MLINNNDEMEQNQEIILNESNNIRPVPPDNLVYNKYLSNMQ